MKKLLIILILLSFTFGNSQETVTDSILNSIKLSRVQKGYTKVIFRGVELEPNFTLVSKAEAYCYMVSFFNNGEKAYVQPALIEISAKIDLSKINIIKNNSDFNIIEHPLSFKSVDAVDILEGQKERYVYYMTSLDTFPTINGSTLIEGSHFKPNNIYKLIIRTTLDTSIEHFYINLEL